MARGDPRVGDKTLSLCLICRISYQAGLPWTTGPSEGLSPAVLCITGAHAQPHAVRPHPVLTVLAGQVLPQEAN